MSVLIKDIQKNTKEIIRVEISEYMGKELINLRIWFQAIDDNGNYVYKPSQKGVALNISQYEELRDAIQRIGDYIQDRNAGNPQS